MNDLTIPTTNGPLAPAAEPGPATPCGKLVEALAACRDRCKAAPHDAVNAFHKYRYSSAEVILAEAGRAMKNSGLTVIPVRERLTVLDCGSVAVYTLDLDLLLAHSSGECLPLEVRGWPVIPDKGRPLDKAFASALTTSLAYKLRDLLGMPRTDPADDIAAREDREEQPPAPPRKAEPPAPAPRPTAAARTKPTLPATGYELVERLTLREEQLVEQGLCNDGDLLNHVENWGERQDPPLLEPLTLWPVACFGAVARLVTEWEKALRHARVAATEAP